MEKPTYRKVKDLYDRLHESGQVTQTLPEWSEEMNRLSKTDLFSAGLHDNWIKRASVEIDRALEETGLPQLSKELGGEVGALLDARESGEAIGESLPRMGVNMASFLIPGAGWANAARLGIAGALTGAETYTETGSPAAGGLSGVTAMALPGITGKVEQFAAKKLGSRLVEGQLADTTGQVVGKVSRAFPETTPQKLGTFFAGQGGAAGLMEVSAFGQDVIAEQPLHDPFTVDTLLNLTLGQLPFAGIHATNKVLGRKGPSADTIQHAVDKSAELIELRKVRETVPDRPDFEPPSPEVIRETQLRLAQLRGEQVSIRDNPNISPEDKLPAVNRLLLEERDTLRQQAPMSNSVFGDTIRVDSPRQQVVGRELKSNGRWRAIMVDDIPANPEELRGKVVSYSTAYEPNPQQRPTGDTVFGLPDSQWRTVKSQEEWASRTRKKGDGTPELPIQEFPATEEQMFSHIQDLKKVETEVDTAQTPADLQQAVVRLQNVQHENGLPPTNDATIRRTVAELERSGAEPGKIYQTAVKVESKRTARRIQATQERSVVVEDAGKFRLQQEETARTDPGVQAEVNNLHRLEANLAAKPTKHADQLISGELNRLYKQWVDEGKVGGFEKFAEDVWTIARTGKGLLKPVRNLEEIASLPKDESNTPFGTKVTEAAYTITNADVTTKREDVGLFRTIIDQLGVLPEAKSSEIDDVAQFISDRDGTPLVEIKDEINDFLTRPHVKVWERNLEAQIAKIRETNSEPGRGIRPPPGERLVMIQRADGTTFQASFGDKFYEGNRASVARLTPEGKWSHTVLGEGDVIVETPEPNRAPNEAPFVPQTPHDVERVQELGLERGGVGLHEFILRDTNPVIKATAEGLRPFTDILSRVEVMIGETESGMAATYDVGEGKTRIVIPPANLDSPLLGFTVAHELIHGATISELNNPTKVGLVKEFDGLRDRLIQSLPKEQQARLNDLLKTGWKEKYVRGEVEYNSIYPEGTENDRTRLYSLLNTKEMVAQGLSSRQMQVFMRSVKTEKGNWFSRFTDTVKDLLGIKVEGTLFEEFLTRTDQLLAHGNHLASFREFSERYFENLGLSDNMAMSQTRRALGVVLDSGFGTSKEELIARLGQSVGVQSPEFYTAKKRLNIVLEQKGDALREIEQIMGEVGFGATLKDLDTFVHEALSGNVARHSDILDMLPREASDYVFAKAKDMQDVLGVLKAATNESNKGLLNLADPAVLRGPVREALKGIERVMEARRTQETGEQLIHEMFAMTPDVFADRTELSPKIMEDFGNESPRKPGHISFFLRQASRWARTNLVTAELIDRGYELGSNSATMKGNILKVLGYDLKDANPALTKEGLVKSIQAISTPKTSRAVDRWMYWSNEMARREKRGVTMLPDSHPEVQKLLQGLTSVEREGVIDTVAKRSISNQIGQAETLEKMHQIGVVLGAHIVMKDKGVKAPDAIKVADMLFNAARADRTNPQLAQEAEAQVATVQSQMTPEGFLELLKYTQVEVEKFNLWSGYFKKNPDWSTAQRLERYLVSFVRGNKKKQLQASSEKEAKVLSEGGKNVEITDQWKGTEDDFPVLGPDVEGLFQRISELETNQLQALKRTGTLGPEGQATFEKMSVATQLARETAGNQAGVPEFSTPPRLLSQGADELPWFWNHVAHSERLSNFWSRKLYRAQASLHLADPEMSANPELQSMMKTQVEGMLQVDPGATQKVAKFVSTWFLGFNPASAISNGFQTITTAVPEMTLINGGKMLDSYSSWQRAVREVSRQSVPNGKWKTEDHKWLSKQMSEAHEWDFSMYSDEAYTQEAASTDFKRVMMKQKPTTIGQKLGTLSGTWSTTAMWMFKSVERFNNKVASVMAFDHFRNQGLSREEALVETKRFNRAVNYTGGRANRPVGLFSGRGDFSRSAAMLASNMQGYNLGVVGQIADYIQRGFFRPQGITPAEVYAARKASLQILSTQFVAAGALGLPFASGAIALLNTLFPDLEINRHVREWAKDFFAGDKANGGTLGDIALTGLPSMLGWDMQSRLSMGNVVPGVSEYNGFQPENLLGPPVNLVRTFVNGAARVAVGDPKGAENFLPPGVKKLFQLVADDGKLKDYRDRPLFTPTMGETAGIALGFQPKKLSDFNAAQRIVEQNRLVSTRREGRFHQQQAEETLRGNFGTVRQALNERAQTEKNYSAIDAVRSIARSAEELTFPRDLHREGTKRTATDRNKLLSAFNLAPSEPSEVARLTFRHQIEQRLGLVRRPDRRELQLAQLVDQLHEQHPEESRVELRMRATQMLRVRPQRQSLLQELPQ